jgi:hypothetical protein
MKTKFMLAAIPLIAALACSACQGKGSPSTSSPQANSAQTNTTGELRSKAPEGWVTEKTSSSMRVAQYKLPRVEGDKDDGSLVLYYFGSSQGGTAQANIDRWIGQMQQPDGSSSKDIAKTETMTVNGLKVTAVDVTGTYTAEMAPGSGSFSNDENYCLRAAVIETPKGNYLSSWPGRRRRLRAGTRELADFLCFEFK